MESGGKKPTGIWILQKFMPPVRSGTAGIFYDIPKLAKELSLSPEEAGRKVRYDSFRSVASEYENSRIAVAHHGNDRAETVILI